MRDNEIHFNAQPQAWNKQKLRLPPTPAREREALNARAQKKGPNNSRLYCVAQLLSRCRNPNNDDYADYGGRGITVCERWLKFENFLEDMGEPPDGLTIDRTDSNGNYCKANCTWATVLDQNNNRRNTVRITFDGVTLTLSEWAARLGVSYQTLKLRRLRKWSIERMLMQPHRYGT